MTNMEWHKLDNFTRGYVECLLWSTNDESDESGGSPLQDNYDWGDFSDDAKKEIVEVCQDFQTANADDLATVVMSRDSYDYSSAGHDFWLTRNGHGAGFWDRGFGAAGDRLSEAAKVYGGVDPYVGDDGVLYL